MVRRADRLTQLLRRAPAQLLATPPPGPFRRRFWRSPLRGPWLTSVFGLILLVGLTVVIVTGLLSYAAYNPDLPGNDQTPMHGLFGFYLFAWPTHPHWLYRFTQGAHVTVGIVLVPVLLAKLWSVLPKLFEWPPIRSVAHALERVSLLALVGGVIFEFVTGLLNMQYWYVFPGSFYSLHLYGAWVFIGAMAVHVSLKFSTMVSALRSRRLRDELRIDTAATLPEPPDSHDLVSPHPAAASLSRRGVLGLVGSASAALFLASIGQSLGGDWRRTALLSPRGQDPSNGNRFQVNKSARAAGINPSATGANWRLTLLGGAAPVSFSREDLLAMPQHQAHLPIACVEGWATEDLPWAGVPLRELARAAGVPNPSSVYVESIQGWGFGRTTLRGNQVMDPDSLLALTVYGVDLTPDHGFPARVIVPANPGVHNTKWVTRMTFHA